jgi:hypothetical protein
MPSSGLLGPFPLTEEAIAAEIEPLIIGVYLLGRLKGKRFFVRRVGRADRDLAAELRPLIGQYDAFKYRTYGSTRRAFAKECDLFHTFSPPETTAHPVRPKDTRFTCPVATCPEAE